MARARYQVRVTFIGLDFFSKYTIYWHLHNDKLINLIDNYIQYLFELIWKIRTRLQVLVRVQIAVGL
jgi:hypothetical protein